MNCLIHQVVQQFRNESHKREKHGSLPISCRHQPSSTRSPLRAPLVNRRIKMPQFSVTVHLLPTEDESSIIRSSTPSSREDQNKSEEEFAKGRSEEIDLRIDPAPYLFPWIALSIKPRDIQPIQKRRRRIQS